MLRRIAVALMVLALAGCTVKSEANTAARARMLVHKGQEKEAIGLLRDHLAAHPGAIDERKLLIRILALTGDLGAAEREATALSERLGQGDPTPWIEMGYALELTHRYEEALAMFDRAAQVAPRDARGPRAGGLRSAQWGEVELAEPRLTEALRRDPRDARSWHALGVVRFKLGDLAGAERAYAAGLKADPASLESHLGLATVAVARGDAASALVHYDALCRARPKHGDLRLGRAWALLKLSRLAEAERELAEAEQLGASAGAIRAQRRLLATLKASAEAQRIR
ncbi:MAG: tetratricopeptide repeat protein [Polyangiaceae bacterium]|nr:tetratricopeptide repeat protein [Polyangiaceae bacterium]